MGGGGGFSLPEPEKPLPVPTKEDTEIRAKEARRKVMMTDKERGGNTLLTGTGGVTGSAPVSQVSLTGTNTLLGARG